ncbi:uncharacterized mitochondrial protein-like protein [Tanacetum coccineum]
MQEELLKFQLQKVWTLVDLPNGKRAIGTKWVFRNKKDKGGIVIRNKARLLHKVTPRRRPQFPDKVYKEEKHYKVYIKLQEPDREPLQQKEDGIFISQDKYVAEILKKFDFAIVKTASTLIETNKALVKDEEAKAVDVHLYRSMIGSLMYLTASRPDIMFVVYSPFDLWLFQYMIMLVPVLDMKSTIGGCQFLGKRLISWQCKKQTIVANSTTEAEYVVAANCCGQIGPPIKVGDEAVHKELDDRTEKAATNASSLEAEQDSGSDPRCQDTILGDVDAQTRFETTSKQSNDPPLSRGYTLRSGEDNMKLLELMKLYTKLSNMLHKNRKSDLVSKKN